MVHYIQILPLHFTTSVILDKFTPLAKYCIRIWNPSNINVIFSVTSVSLSVQWGLPCHELFKTVLKGPRRPVQACSLIAHTSISTHTSDWSSTERPSCITSVYISDGKFLTVKVFGIYQPVNRYCRYR